MPTHAVTGTQWLVSGAQFALAATPARVLSTFETNGSAKMTDGVRPVSKIWNEQDTGADRTSGCIGATTAVAAGATG